MRVQTLNGRFLLFGSLSMAHMVVMFTFSLILLPPTLTDVPGGGSSFLPHFTACAVLSVLVYETFRSSAWSLSPITRCLLGFTCAFLYSFALELLQLLTLIRQFEVGDIVANFLGAFFGVFVMVAVRKGMPEARKIAG